MEKLEIQSPAFATGAPIPKEYTQQGSDMSPPLEICLLYTSDAADEL